MFKMMVVPPIDLERLRQLTQEGKKRRQEIQEKLVAAVKEEEKEALRAEAVIESIPRLVEMQAGGGENKAEVMTLAGDEFDSQMLGPQGQSESPFEVTAVKPEWLLGAARIVWDYCCGIGLKPTLKSWTDSGMAPMWGYIIVVHW